CLPDRECAGRSPCSSAYANRLEPAGPRRGRPGPELTPSWFPSRRTPCPGCAVVNTYRNVDPGPLLARRDRARGEGKAVAMIIARIAISRGIATRSQNLARERERRSICCRSPAASIQRDTLLIEPDVCQILVEVMAGRDLPAVHIGAHRHDPIPVGHHQLVS